MSILTSSIENKIEHTEKYSVLSHTNFLDPYECAQVKHLVKHERHVFWGGHDEAERRVLFILPDYLEQPPVDEYVRLIRLTSKSPESLGHRDYLGSLMGLGIKREKIGDISVFEDGADVLVMADIAKYVSEQLSKVARSGISCELIDVEHFRIPVRNTATQKVFVASMRLDCILAAVYNISRGSAQQFIDSERVFIDWHMCNSTSKLVAEGSMISLRGTGRFLVNTVTGNTKKGRIVLEIEIY